VLLAAFGAQAQETNVNQNTASRLREAASLSASGNFAAAENIYDQLLENSPGNVEARLGRAHVRSYRKKFAESHDDFQIVLRSDPNNLSALNGLGYSFAWAGKYAQAEEPFQKTLRVAPGQPDALKGLAYVALWRGDGAGAARRFEGLAKTIPTNAEIQVGLGQALLNSGRKSEARKAFQRALQLEPGRADAKDGEAATRSVKPRVDFTVLGGVTRFRNGGPVNNSNQTGVRFLEFAVEPKRNVRLWFQYDNGLSLDNFSLAQSNRHVPTYYVGGLVNYKRHYTTRLEFGWRTLDNNVKQKIIRTEQVFILPRAYTLKFGGWFGPRSDNRTETIFHAGVGVPVGERFRLEPTVFYSRSGLPGDSQVRGLLAGEYRFKNDIRLGGGFAGGRRFSNVVLSSRAVKDVYVTFSVPVGDYLRAQTLLRHESLGNSNSITVLAFGFTVSNRSQR
jgi:Flp pilus assembly protein TadD